VTWLAVLAPRTAAPLAWWQMSDSSSPTCVDAVVVSYQSRATLRSCVEPLCSIPGVAVTVVDNESSDGSLASVAGLPLRALASGRNGGFGFGCNLGAADGRAPYLLFVNPDATIDRQTLDVLVAELEADPGLAAAGPRILDSDGSLQRTQRNYPRLRSTWAQTLFVHRIAPRARWADEVIWDAAAYERAGSPDWLSGACLLVRREAFEAVGGFDERFFLYCEDIDLCRRLRQAGHDLRFGPGATVRHVGGASAPRTTTNPIYARSRIAYARKHYRRPAVALERTGVAVGEATHALMSAARPQKARAHLAALRAVLTPIGQGV
jgi:N-acetylglucosaminyl-diphospho-decaprenol L-rhamnosyltransferase